MQQSLNAVAQKADTELIFCFEKAGVMADVDDPNPQAVTTFNVDASKYKVLVWCDYVHGRIYPFYFSEFYITLQIVNFHTTLNTYIIISEVITT